MYYRKYRPQVWADIDNVRVRESLGKSILDDNWTHAYLLVGNRGTGKTTTARLIAKTINCTDRKKGEEPCNKCDSCVAISNGSSMDVIEIDAASHTGVDDIRDLRDKVRLAPTTSKFKVYIIDEVHMLSTSAFNALLKTLEEPPAHVVFVLATTDPQKLPETIISRCLVYDFGRAGQDEIISGLKKIAKAEKLEVESDVFRRVAEISQGSHRDAAKILEQLASQSAKIDMGLLDKLNTSNFAGLAKELIELSERGKKEEIFEKIESATEGDDIKVSGLTDNLLIILKDQLLSGDKKISGQDLWWLTEKIIEAQRLSINCPVPQLPLELVFANWCEQHNTKEELVVKREDIIAEKEQTKNDEGSKKKDESQDKGTENMEGPTESIDVFDLIVARWSEIVAATKPFNHSLMAVLKAGKPKKISANYLIINVLYKFHKEKLEEAKNRDILEKVISDIIKAPIKVKFELAEKRGE